VNLKTAIADEKYERDNQDALDNLQKRTGKNHTYYVSPDCGNTLEEVNIVKCLDLRAFEERLCRGH
jgi:predicted DNA-binding protein